MVRPFSTSKRMITSTPKAHSKSPEGLPPLHSTPKADPRASTSSVRKRRRSSLYKTRKSSKNTSTRKYRHHPGMRALREIRHYQRTWSTVIPKLPFSRLVREILSMFGDSFRIQSLALEALHEAAEAYVIGILEKANLCSIHARRVTLMPPDIKLVRRIKESY